MINKKEQDCCSVPDCYNSPATHSEFCIKHQGEISFEIETVSVWCGDEMVGVMDMTATPSPSFEMKANNTGIVKMKNIVDAVSVRSPKFSHTKYHSNWEEE